MALITCPDCNHHPVSDRAEACPRCGFPVAKELRANSTIQHTELPREQATSLVVPFNALVAAAAQESSARSNRCNVVERNSLGGELTLIPSGEFDMGNEDSVETLCALFPYGVSTGIGELFFRTALKNLANIDFDRGRFDNASYRHRVLISRPFHIARHQITVSQFRCFVEETGYRPDSTNSPEGGMGFDQGEIKREKRFNWSNAGFNLSQPDEHPVVNVSWNDAAFFCNWLSRREKRSEYYCVRGTQVTREEGNGYRLPTEAEWEFACRAGSAMRFFYGNAPEGLLNVANTRDSSIVASFPNATNVLSGSDGYVFTAPVGRFTPNAFGIYDMHGNVWEWCWDRHSKNYYGLSPMTDPTGPIDGHARVIRGGGWNSMAWECRSASRGLSGSFQADLGFRVACSCS